MDGATKMLEGKKQSTNTGVLASCCRPSHSNQPYHNPSILSPPQPYLALGDTLCSSEAYATQESCRVRTNRHGGQKPVPQGDLSKVALIAVQGVKQGAAAVVYGGKLANHPAATGGHRRVHVGGVPMEGEARWAKQTTRRQHTCTRRSHPTTLPSRGRQSWTWAGRWVG